jgi:hypothetical protein
VPEDFSIAKTSLSSVASAPESVLLEDDELLELLLLDVLVVAAVLAVVAVVSVVVVEVEAWE